MKRVAEIETPHGLKCGTFGACSPATPVLATGSSRGELNTWDLSRLDTATWAVPAAHGSRPVNAVDGVAGGRPGLGAPELATAGADGRVCVWDPRVRDAPVLVLEPEAGCAHNAWAVAFGDVRDADSRCLAAGYDNGDVKLFDLRTGTARYECNVGNGVVALEFDRREIAMNTLAVSCLDSMLHVIDCRTQHPEHGMARASVRCPAGATLWGAKHTPQNRDVFMVHAGNGGMFLYKYRYPDARSVNDKDDRPMGVAGAIDLIAQTRTATAQPVHCFDWNRDKEGLAVYGSYDQCLRIMTVTGLSKLG
jgi:WD repeat-containing protein 92